MKIKYEELTLQEIEIMYNYFKELGLEQAFTCDGDNQVIIVEE